LGPLSTNKEKKYLALVRLSSRYSVTLDVLRKERKKLEATCKELAALLSKPGTSNDEKERLQEEQKQIELQIEACEMVIDRLLALFCGASD
jgi:hypothetical protein